VLVPELPEDVDVVTELLELVRGGKVSLRVPQRGDKRALLETVERNAKEAFTRHKLKRSSDLTSRSRALQELQDALGLPQAPLRIECYDVSNLQGSDIVASMVVFEDGLPRKSEYRRFAIKGIARPDRDPVQIDVAVPAHNDVAVPAHSDVAVPAHSDVAVPAHSDVAVPAQNDTAAIHEVISRRFRRYLEERIDLAEIELDDSDEDREAGHSVGTPIDPDTGKPRKFAYPPQLVVVDGGAPQVAAAAAAMAALGIEDVSLCGLAKRLEEVWLPGSPDPVILPRTSEALYLLQRVRDEAHRFAITYHRQRRSAGMTASALDGVPGLGETRRKALLRRFGSVKRLRAASVEEIAAVPGLGRRTAEAVHAALAASGPGQPAVDPTTGEVLESGDTSGVSVAGSGAPS
jgi:excinuclease ABC subunit C